MLTSRSPSVAYEGKTRGGPGWLRSLRGLVRYGMKPLAWNAARQAFAAAAP